MLFFKRLCFVVFFCFLFCRETASAHTIFHRREGFNLHIAPAFTYQRLYSKPNNHPFTSDNIAFRCFLGFTYDYFLRKNYYFNTGFLYRFHQIFLQKKKNQPAEIYQLQYLQVPLLLKAYIFKVQNKCFFVNIGPVVALNTHFNYDQKGATIAKVALFELAGTTFFGFEHPINRSTSVYAALQYQLGFTNISPTLQIQHHRLYLKNNFWSIHLGIKF